MYRKLTSFILTLFMSVSFLCPVFSVSADEWSDAQEFDGYQNVDLEANESQIFRFTAPQTGTYRFYSSYGYNRGFEERNGDPRITLFDSNHSLLAYNDNDPWVPEGNVEYNYSYRDQFGYYISDSTRYNYKNFYLEYDLVRNVTYYIKLEAGSEHSSFNFRADRGINVYGELRGASYSGNGWQDSPVQETNEFYLFSYGNIRLSVNNQFLHGDDYTYTWYDDDNDPFHRHPIPSYENNLHLTVVEGNYSCVVQKDGYAYTVRFIIRHDADHNFIFPDMEYFLLSDGEAFEYTSPAAVNGTYTFSYRQIAVDQELDYDYSYRDLVTVNGATLAIPSGIHGYCVYNYIIKQDGTETWIPQTLFYLGDTTDGEITDGQSYHIDVENPIGVSYLLNGTCQQIYTYTPDESGTVTFSARQHGNTGVPDVVVFDHDRNYLGHAGGDQFFADRANRYDYSGEECVLNLPETRTFSTHVEAGQTYYVAIPVMYFGMRGTVYYHDKFNTDFDLSVNFEVDPPAAAAGQIDSGSSSTGSTSSSSAGSSSGQPSSSSPAPVTANATQPPYTAPISGTSVSAANLNVGDFVERLYTVALGRASDPVGKQDWIDAVTMRDQTGADLARGFLYSQEFLGKNVSNEEFVKVLYRTFFDREADADGLNGWVNVLNNGGSKEHVIEGFINSTEWANLCLQYGIRSGGTGTPNIEVEPNQQTIDFATRLYTTCLNRNADRDGLMAWARQLANQRDTGTGAARGFFFSSEFTGQNVSNGEYVSRLYRTFMGREPDSDGYNAWVSQLDSGVSREEVFNGFAQSVEFARICAQYGIVR